MKYKRVGENKYRKCMGALTEALLIILIFVAFLVLGVVL